MKALLTNGLGAPKATLLDWLGFGNDAQADGPETERARVEFVRDARKRLLEQICSFLLENELEITPQNLRVAHSAFAGLNPSLRRTLQQHLDNGETISQSWLDQETAFETQGEDESSVDLLVCKLEQGLDDFSRTTKTARDATSEYGDALEQHVGRLEAAPDEGDIIADLAGYARAMLARSRKAEADLRHSESEAAALRQNLDRARREAELDFLTGLSNRRAFEAELTTQYAEAKRAGDPLCVAFCDIDHFKMVNDTHGHEAGDRILCVVAETLSKVSSDKCHIARHGGEEFVMLFRGKLPNEAQKVLNYAREQLSARKLVNRKTEKPFEQVTFSGGIADVFAFGDPREALAAADEALYQAKSGGRNQIRLAQTPA